MRNESSLESRWSVFRAAWAPFFEAWPDDARCLLIFQSLLLSLGYLQNSICRFSVFNTSLQYNLNATNVTKGDLTDDQWKGMVGTL